MREFHIKRRAARKTPFQWGNGPGDNVKLFPERKPRSHYRVTAYGHAITKACETAFPTPRNLALEQRQQWRMRHRWHPHQLRHNAATQLRKQYGLDVAQIILGHKTLAVTQIYAERDMEAAKRVTMSVG